jgi:hypothetical protein
MPYLENSQSELFSEVVQNSTCNPPKVWRNLIPGTTEPDYGSSYSTLSAREHSFTIESAVGRRFLEIEHEEFMNRNAELRGEHFQILKRRSVYSSLDQAEKVYGDTKQLREFLLAHVPSRTYCSDAIAEFFAECRQINVHLSVDSRLQALLTPPNDITGSFWGSSSDPIAAHVRYGLSEEKLRQGKTESAIRLKPSFGGFSARICVSTLCQF